jgi:glutamyl-tRNA reductase
VVEGDQPAAPAVWALYAERVGGDASGFGYVRRDRDAVAHLFRVVSGIDSMVVGEAQIHGQVRDAWESSRSSSGAVLNRLFQTALLVGGRVRSETELGHGAMSVSSAAVQLAKKIFGSLVGKRAMVLGAGEMAELALASLQAEGVRAAVVANRTFERAQALADLYGASAVRYEEAWTALADVDVLLCSTASPHVVVGADRVRDGLARRGDRPLCILDIALPRDVDPAVRGLHGVFLYDLDDLRSVAEANLRERQRDAAAAEALVESEVVAFLDAHRSRRAVPLLVALRERAEEIRRSEIAKARPRLGPLTPEQERALDSATAAIVNKLLHTPTVCLKEMARTGQTDQQATLVRRVLGLA